MPWREDVKAHKDDVRVIESIKERKEKGDEFPSNNRNEPSDEMICNVGDEDDENKDNGWIKVRKKKSVKAHKGVQEMKDKGRIFAKSEKINLANLCGEIYMDTTEN